MTNHNTPQVFATCLAAYNNGHLHGRWIDATDPDDMRAEIADILATSPEPNAEEHFFSDTDGFGNLVSEYTSVEHTARLGALIEENGLTAVEFVASYASSDIDDIECYVEEVERYSAGPYASQRETLECWVQEVTEEISGELPNWVQVDWEATAQNMLMDYHHEFSSDGDLLLIRV